LKLDKIPQDSLSNSLKTQKMNMFPINNLNRLLMMQASMSLLHKPLSLQSGQ